MAYHIYLIDDDKFLLDLYALKFKNAGHEVRVFNGGEELLAALREEGVKVLDALLIDVIMPNLTGFETIEMVRKEQLAQGAKIIFLSNQGQDSDFAKAKSLGADGYIIKASAIPSEVLAETLRIISNATMVD